MIWDIDEYIPYDEQPPEICLTAVRQDGYALQSVKEQTPEICLAVVGQNPEAVKYIKV